MDRFEEVSGEDEEGGAAGPTSIADVPHEEEFVSTPPRNRRHGSGASGSAAAGLAMLGAMAAAGGPTPAGAADVSAVAAAVGNLTLVPGGSAAHVTEEATMPPWMHTPRTQW